jgi:hypothetical protein
MPSILGRSKKASEGTSHPTYDKGQHGKFFRRDRRKNFLPPHSLRTNPSPREGVATGFLLVHHAIIGPLSYVGTPAVIAGLSFCSCLVLKSVIYLLFNNFIL